MTEMYHQKFDDLNEAKRDALTATIEAEINEVTCDCPALVKCSSLKRKFSESLTSTSLALLSVPALTQWQLSKVLDRIITVLKIAKYSENKTDLVPVIAGGFAAMPPASETQVKKSGSE
ncbi:hypothetical protein FPV67DRAFT_1444715 [Lyophyllum atratum]|nr:hypothetical protein FPV67DRAFT_1444715 [Lyophyllum atratum]